jgi:hypothetical protein
MSESIGGKWTLDITDLRSGITEANRLIRVADSEFKAAAAGMGDWTKNADGLTAKIKSLNTIVDVQEQKVSALKKEYADVVKEKGANSKAAQDLEVKINNETASLNKNKLELEKTQTALNNFGVETVDTAKKQEELKNKTEQVTEKVNDFAKKALVAVTAAAAAAGAALFKLSSDAGKFADDIITMSNKTGISVRELQELDYAARFVDVSVDTMASSMNKLTRTMDSARDSMAGGNKNLNAQAQAYQKLGVQVTNTDGSLRNNKEVFYEVIDALGQMTNETERDAIAMELFGKSAVELNPLIKAGSDELNRLAKEAHQVGAVVSDDAVTALGQFDDNMNVLKASTEGLTRQALAELMPYINDLVNSLKENMPAIIEGIKGFIDFVIENAPNLISLIGGIAAGLLAWNVVSMIQGIITGIKGWQAATEGMTLAQKLLNIVMAANPIGIIITLIAALIGWFVTMMATNEEFRKKVIKVWNDAWAKIKEVGDNIKKFFTETLPEAFNNIGEFFKDIGKWIVEGVWNGIKGMGNWINDKVGGFFGGMVDGVKKFLGINSPSKVFAGIGENMALGLGDGFTDEMKSINKEIQNAIPTSIGTNIGVGFNHGTGGVATGSNLNFTQNIYSPKALTPYEVYRQTKNASQQLALGVVR